MVTRRRPYFSASALRTRRAASRRRVAATDADARLGGRVVYARDFGARNALLRERFGDRAWYRARVEQVDGVLRARIEPVPH